MTSRLEGWLTPSFCLIILLRFASFTRHRLVRTVAACSSNYSEHHSTANFGTNRIGLQSQSMDVDYKLTNYSSTQTCSTTRERERERESERASERAVYYFKRVTLRVCN